MEQIGLQKEKHTYVVNWFFLKMSKQFNVESIVFSISGTEINRCSFAKKLTSTLTLHLLKIKSKCKTIL